MTASYQNKRTLWLKQWSNAAIDSAANRYGNKSSLFYEVLSHERRKFSLSCYNKTRSKKAQDEFLDAIEYVREKYGYVSAEIVAEQMDISVDHFYVLKKRIEDLISEDFNVINAKVIRSRNTILTVGESVHYDDRKIITKSRIHKKSNVVGTPITRPTIDAHWKVFEPNFNYLNEKLNIE